MNTDRSRIISYQSCPRQRYLSYHHLGSGIQRIRKSLPLQFGSAFHEGAETLLKPDLNCLLREDRIEMAVLAAHGFLLDQFDSHQIGFDGETPPDIEKAMEYGREEQMALAEALLRAWWAYEGESFLESFEVIEVEQEGRAQLSDDLTLMFRPDALVKDKQSGDLYVVSWKTCSTFTKRTIDQARHDMQSISEVWGISSTGLDFGGGRAGGAKIEGVLYKWIVKGQRRLDAYDGIYKQGSHLVYGWAKLDTLKSEFPEWSWTYEWPREDGSGNSRLGKGWQKKPIWRDYPGGVKQWITDLASNSVFPRHLDPLGSVFPQALPVERRLDEVESWKRQVISQETSIAERLGDETLYAANEQQMDFLDTHFPQHTHSCHSYSGCPFIPVCWEGVKPEPGDIYQIREANHPEKDNED